MEVRISPNSPFHEKNAYEKNFTKHEDILGTKNTKESDYWQLNLHGGFFSRDHDIWAFQIFFLKSFSSNKLRLRVHLVL